MMQNVLHSGHKASSICPCLKNLCVKIFISKTKCLLDWMKLDHRGRGRQCELCLNDTKCTLFRTHRKLHLYVWSEEISHLFICAARVSESSYNVLNVLRWLTAGSEWNKEQVSTKSHRIKYHSIADSELDSEIVYAETVKISSDLIFAV